MSVSNKLPITGPGPDHDQLRIARSRFESGSHCALESPYGRTLAYLYIDAAGEGRYEHLFNKDLVRLGFARVTTFSDQRRREFKRVQEEARNEERDCGARVSRSKTIDQPCRGPRLVHDQATFSGMDKCS
jgi:hypothetical protein